MTNFDDQVQVAEKEKIATTLINGEEVIANENDLPYDAHTRMLIMKQAFRDMINFCHGAQQERGWWKHAKTGEDLRFSYSSDVEPTDRQQFTVVQKLDLCHSELSEGLEALRKQLKDDKLPQYNGLTVEVVDLIIRAFDLLGGIGLREEAIAAFIAKSDFNAYRPDHGMDNRQKKNGKLF